MLVDLLPLMIGGAAIVHSFFLIAVLLRLSTKLPNRLLATTLFLLAIRMAGCIIGLIYTDLELAGLYVGAVSFSLIGPFTYFYLHSLWHPAFRLSTINGYHLAPAILVALTLPFVSAEVVFVFYQLSMLAMIVYIIASVMKVKKMSAGNRLDHMRWTWTVYFNSGMAILLLLFLAQSFYFDSVIYEGIIVGSAFVLYYLTLVAVKQVKLFMFEPIKKNKQQEIEELGKRIENFLSKEEVFTDPLMSVSLLAKHLKVPSYLVSLAINSYSEKSFPEMINTLRIQKAEQLLTDPNKSHFTIEAIAYESGFSALSAFYAAFKRAHRKTPTKFRNLSLKPDMRRAL